MTYTITYEENPQADDIQILNKGISEQARQKKGLKPLEFFAFFIRDADNKIMGGCAGNYFYGCLYVSDLWIDERLRSNGYGTKLMQEAEKLAKKSDAQFMAVNTFDWEALGFYKKLGFYVEFERKGFDKDSVFYFLRKDLSSPMNL